MDPQPPRVYSVKRRLRERQAARDANEAAIRAARARDAQQREERREGMSGRQYREERARVEAQQAPSAQPGPQEITMSRKTAFQMGIWAAAGAVVFLVIILPIIVVVLIAVAGALGIQGL